MCESLKEKETDSVGDGLSESDAVMFAEELSENESDSDAAGDSVILDKLVDGRDKEYESVGIAVGVVVLVTARGCDLVIESVADGCR